MTQTHDLIGTQDQDKKKYHMGLVTKKTCLWGYVNNKGADQPGHPRSLISAFVIIFLESTISNLATSVISIF